MGPYYEEVPAVAADPESERVLLNTLCLGPDNPEVPDVLRLLNGGESFHVPQCQAVYVAFRAVHKRHEDIDSISLKCELERQGTIGKVGGFVGLNEMFDASASEVRHPLKLAQRISDLGRRRELQRLAGRIQQDVLDTSIPLAEILEPLQALGRVQETRILSVVNAGAFLDAPAPEPRWLVPGVIPQGVPVVMASKGGVGKSFVALQLCIALATGKGFLSCEAQAPMGAVYFGLEDDKDTFHRRVKSIVEHYKACDDWTDEDDQALRENFIAPFINWKAARATSYLPSLAAELAQILEGMAPGIVVVDTLARVSEGDENTVQALRPILNALNLIVEFGWTPLVLHHVAKGQDGARGDAKKKPLLTDRMSTEWVRGSSAIVDNFRCVLQLTLINPDEAAGAGLDEDNARMGGYAVFGPTKLNSGQKVDWLFIEQDEHGRWFTPRDGMETLARIRGTKAVTALDKQIQILFDLYQATRWGGQADLTEIAKNHYPDKEITKAKNALHQVISKLRRAGLLQKTGHAPTVQGLQKIQVSERDNRND